MAVLKRIILSTQIENNSPSFQKEEKEKAKPGGDANARYILSNVKKGRWEIKLKNRAPTQ